MNETRPSNIPIEYQQKAEGVEMRIDPLRAEQLITSLSSIKARIQSASIGKPVRIVAVSKLKPVNDILALHRAPTSHLHFGENYLQELSEKASFLPRSIQWHFIGALQTNKCSSLARIPNLYLVSSIDAKKKADELNKGRGKYLESLPQRQPTTKPVSSDLEEDEATNKEDMDGDKIGVHVQVNTSGEDSKSGVPPQETTELCRHIIDNCPHLRLRGLMTIGAIARSQATKTASQENEDFRCLRDTRDRVARELGWDDETELELSMGMSEDFETAVRMGSDEVRVGSTIFGERPARKDAKIKEDVVQEGTT
ncbi:MAG: hypothetical protein M1823_001288 [Watsoniomyces obsoletus]|nr:MAG: hypothetical protein M1823_001288 [Watsoniomyces obsoletus]